MHPVLFEPPWGGTVNSYGTMILLGVLVTMAGVSWDARGRGIAEGRRASFVVDAYLVMIVGSFVGGRLFYVITRPVEFLADPGRIFTMESTGFVFFGSLAASVAGLLWVASRYGTAFSELCDLILTWVPLMHFFGRLGCFSAGCCYGAPWSGPWALSFPAESIAFLDPAIPRIDGGTTPLHPTQLYEAVGLLGLFLTLLAFRRLRGAEPRWRQASRYALGYGILRLCTELWRGDAHRKFIFETRWPDLADALSLPHGHVFALSTSQAVAMVLVGVGIWGLRRSRRRS
jgi:phosphatidylglycerol:prolipoprotein diacylglycerol transferase